MIIIEFYVPVKTQGAVAVRCHCAEAAWSLANLRQLNVGSLFQALTDKLNEAQTVWTSRRTPRTEPRPTVDVNRECGTEAANHLWLP
jgi:hypothetical protein